ncbi:divalent metal cation transporter [bacterium]|nr:divalent metal cation transporter [bacterium]
MKKETGGHPPIRRGLPMAEKRDAKALAAEAEALRRIEKRPSLLSRWRGYWHLSGPGWLQSAVTLGAGSAASSLFAGSAYGYRLLWVQPVSMFLGVIMFAAIGKQVLVTRERPFDVFRTRLHPTLAWFWVFNVLLASIVWQFPQYSLGTALLRDMFSVAGITLPALPAALIMLTAATLICNAYGSGRRRSIRLFEKTLKTLVMVMVAAFLGVVIKTGVRWDQLASGYFSFYIPGDVRGITIVLGALGAAVGVNMTFLYPYTLLARGWGRSHLGLKNFDLATSTFLPFVAATSLVIIAAANTLHPAGIEVKSAVDVAHILEPLIGITLSRIVFSFGIVSMCLTTLVLEMLIAGFVLSEVFGFEFSGKAFFWSTMTANIGIIGAFYAMPFWLPVLTSSFNLIMLPLAYLGFFLLQNRRDYLGEERNRGFTGLLWNTAMGIAIIVVTLGAVVKVLSLLELW